MTEKNEALRKCDELQAALDGAHRWVGRQWMGGWVCGWARVRPIIICIV